MPSLNKGNSKRIKSEEQFLKKTKTPTLCQLEGIQLGEIGIKCNLIYFTDKYL